MTKHWHWLGLALALTSVSCDDDHCVGPKPEAPATRGRAVIDARLRYDAGGHLYGNGFSFAKGMPILYPNSEGLVPDLLVMVRVESGDVRGVYLGGSPFSPRFHLVARFADAAQARSVFDTLQCVPSQWTYEEIALPTTENDVWVFRVGDRQLAKLLVVDTFAASQTVDSSGIGLTTQYGEVTFDWVYQSGNSGCFEPMSNKALGWAPAGAAGATR